MGTISSLGVGSGLDLNGLLGQLQEAEQQKLQPIQQEIASEEAQVSAYGQMKGALSSLQNSAANLNNPELYESLATNVEGEGVSAVSTNEAQPGSYDVAVDNLATAGSLATERVSEPDTAVVANEETLTFSFNQGDDATFTLAAESTLEDVRDTINASDDARLNASIINDGEGYRLAVNSAETGSSASVTGTNFSQIVDPAAQPATPDATIVQEGQNAALSVNGIDIVSSTNQVEGAIQGVTLNLEEAGTTANVSISQDKQAITDAVSEFVDNFNALKGTINDLTAFDPETGQAGELNGDSATRNVESTLRSTLSSIQSGEGLNALSDVGISLQLDGTLELDQSQLDDVVSNQPDALASFFAGNSDEGGMAGQVEGAISQMLNETGAVQNAINGSERRVDSLNDRLGRTEERINNTIDRYRTQFSQLDTMVAQMNSTSDYLNQQLAGLNSGGGGAGGLL